MLGLFFCLLTFLSLITAQERHIHGSSFVPDAILRVSARNVSVGGVWRYSTLINGSSPGPTLRFEQGRVVWIRVYNDLEDRNTTMHWHGLSQAASPFSDGTPLASQWPIPPLHFFDYELQIPSDSAGTFFYHSHVGFQASTASGSLIIQDRSPPYRYDDDRIVYLSELWGSSDVSIEQGIYSTPIVWPGDSLALLINGKGITRTPSDPSTSNLAVIDVEPSKTYRMRFIGGTTLAHAVLAFEKHMDLSIIEADGKYTRPLTSNLIQIGAGQRFSVLFRTKTCNELRQLNRTEFYIQAETRERPSTSTNYAILRYKTTCRINSKALSTTTPPASPPLTLPPTINGWLDYKLQPLVPNNFPSSSEVSRRIILNVQQIANGSYLWQDNGDSWNEDATDPLPHYTPSRPLLVSMYTNTSGYTPDYNVALAHKGFDSKTHTYPARIGEVLEIVLQNIGSKSLNNDSVGGDLDSHPWHAHGGHFYDAGAGPGVWSAEVMEANLKGSTPVLRDTTMLYRYNTSTGAGEGSGWRAWRLRVQEPGVWMVHCHTLQHILQGMQTVFVFGTVDQILKLPKLQVEGYLTFGGDVYGNSTHAPRVVHFSEFERKN